MTADRLQFGDTLLRVVEGDITAQEVDAIVNAANAMLAGGGGVDGAIHMAGGPEIMAECDEIRSREGGCPTGRAVVTTAGRLKAKNVIHTVGPIWSGGRAGEGELLASAYRESLRLARANGLRTIAFPAISTGVYRFPKDKAAQIALTTSIQEISDGGFTEVRHVLFTRSDYHLYVRAMGSLSPPERPARD